MGRRLTQGPAKVLDITKAARECGAADFLLQHNRDFHAHLERLGIPHEYEEFPGDHTWDYWDLHIQEAIAFHCKTLGIAPAPE